MNNLSEEVYWESIYKNYHREYRKPELIEDHADYILWKKILPRYLSQGNSAKILEIGSAPGEFLVKLKDVFGYIPYGIEITKQGVILNRKIFELNGIDSSHVIQDDFLSENLHEKYKNFFDIVISRGFIEHFSNIPQIIDKHINLLTPEGLLIISIPNLKGMNYHLAKFFNKKSLFIHNVDIMEKNEFIKLFNRHDLHLLFCDYYGIFSFNIFNAEKKSFKSILLKGCRLLQRLLNVILKIICDGRAESATFSPYLIFIGKKSRQLISQ